MAGADNQSVTGVILAGGRGQRMEGRDKGLVNHRGRPLIEYVITALSPQVDELLINANRNINRYQHYGFPVIPDELPEYPGPLAGMLACLGAASHEYVVFVPCDTPALPNSLVERLLHALQTTDKPACFAHDGNRAQPVTAILRSSAKITLAQYLNSGNNKVIGWMEQVNATPVDFSDYQEAFTNINSAADLG